MAIADLTVRGAGVFGLAIAWEAVQRGARVQVIDPAGVGAGASGGIVGALAPHVPERWNAKKAFQFAALIRARDFWPGVAAASGVETGYGATGRLQPLAGAAAVALARERAVEAGALWQGKAEWRVVRAREVPGFAPPSPSGWLVHDTLSARLHPRRACAALAAAIEARGGRIVAEGDEQGAVVHATGWRGLAELSQALGRDLGGGVKGQALLVDFDAGAGAPQVFADGLHFVPHADGTLAIGSTSEREFDAENVTDEALDALHVRAVAAMPVLEGARVVARWAGVRPRASSRAPLLGPWPGRAGHFVANGGFKIGLGIAPEVARVMVDLVLDGVDAIDPALKVEAA